MSILARALPDKVTDNQFRLAVNGQKRELLATVNAAAIRVLLLREHERVNFIGLNQSGIYIADVSIQKRCGFLSGSFKDAHNGLGVQSSETGNGADAHAFAEQMNHLAGLFEVHAQAVERLRFAERFSATVTGIALNDSVFIFIRAGFTAFTRATMTLHLIPFRPSLTVSLYRPDTTEGFGL